MIYVAFTIVAIALYVGADALLNMLERRRGERFENRSIYFFAILMVSAILTFQILQALLS